MQSWKVEPHSGDYELSGGAPVQTNSLLMPAYFRYKIKRRKWLYAPNDEYGSDFYLLTRRPATNAGQVLSNTGTFALKPLLDDGRAKSVEVTLDTLTRNGAGLKTSIVDASGNAETVTFTGLGV